MMQINFDRGDNVAHALANPTVRLLMEKENRFGATKERLRAIKRHLTGGSVHIVRLTTVVAEMKLYGHDSTRAEKQPPSLNRNPETVPELPLGHF
jgi:hypothetical protein